MMTEEKKRRTKRINVNVTESEFERFKALAENNSITLSAYIRLLLSEQANKK